MANLFEKILRAGEKSALRKLQSIARQVNALEEDFEGLTDAELRAETDKFRARLADGQTLEQLLPEAFAAVREAGKRTIGKRHFDVQIMGGAALHQGNVAEMRTGEGKTLVATLPSYLNALTGKGVHVITTNDYLAQYQSELMGRVHRALGLETGVILSSMTPAQRRAQYAMDITYGTNNEFGFDYLRDNMALSKNDRFQRGLNYAIVDEVDSILIDEARTPLIISGRVSDAAQLYYKFASIVRGLKRDVDYEVDEEKRIVSPTEDGISKVEAALGLENLYDAVQQNLVHQFQAALKAKELYKRDKDYIIQSGDVKIVDEFTGRILEGRRWSEGLHQAVEAKEGVKIKEENQTLATITLQNYFRMYSKLAGMTGTAMTEATEFQKIYKLGVDPVPTNMPIARVDHNDDVWVGTGGEFFGQEGSGVARFDGSTWTTFNTSNSELPGNTVFAISIDSGGNKWLGTDSGLATYRAGGVVSVGSEDVATVPNAFRLLQNYPNPFNPTTTIAFHLNAPAHVSIDVVDLLGRHAMILVDGSRPLGQHTVQFDGTGFPSGMYVYRLKVTKPDGRVHTTSRPMVLSK